MNLNENINRIKQVMGLLNESAQEKEIILIDGTSSAGKSETAKVLDAVEFFDSTDPNQWVTIDSDDFGCEDEQCIKNRVKYDHAGDGANLKAGEEFHKKMAIERKGGYGEKMGDTTVAFPKHPHNKDMIQGVDFRNWYMAQEIKYGGHNKIIIDDIGNGILQYLPNEKIKNVLLHAPIYIILKNIGERNKKDVSERRDPKMVLEQYLEKYKATKQKPIISIGDPTNVLTKDGLTDLLKKNGLDDKFIDDFLRKLGVIDNGKYYIKVKDGYMTPKTKLINVDANRSVYIDQFKDTMK
jgi:uridine kinase